MASRRDARGQIPGCGETEARCGRRPPFPFPRLPSPRACRDGTEGIVFKLKVASLRHFQTAWWCQWAVKGAVQHGLLASPCYSVVLQKIHLDDPVLMSRYIPRNTSKNRTCIAIRSRNNSPEGNARPCCPSLDLEAASMCLRLLQTNVCSPECPGRCLSLWGLCQFCFSFPSNHFFLSHWCNLSLFVYFFRA